MRDILAMLLTLITLGIMLFLAYGEVKSGPAWGFFLGIVWQNLCLSILKGVDDGKQEDN